MTIRVVVVDDQALVRGGFAMVLNHQDDIAVVAEAGTGLEAIAAAREHRPDVILMDIRMPAMDGLEATSEILDAADWDVRVLILTTFEPDAYVYRALRAGASGFVLKDIPPEQLVTAVRTVADGGALLAPSITKRLIGRFAARLEIDATVARRLERLTDREREVMVAIARGSNNAEIAEELFIGAATVKSHVSSILTKLGLRDRAQVVVFAYESGLVEAGGHDIGHCGHRTHPCARQHYGLVHPPAARAAYPRVQSSEMLDRRERAVTTTTRLARRDLRADAYPAYTDAPFFAETLELLRSVREHDFETLAARCDDDFGIVDIDTDGSARMIRSRAEWEAWFTELFARLDAMAAATDSEVTAYDAVAADRIGYSVVEFRQLLAVDGAVLAFDCVATIVWKWQDGAWREARWHASLLAGPTPVTDSGDDG